MLGKRADGKARPLEFYGNLELLIATMAALSQPLLWIVGKIYLASGGSAVLGLGGASAVRLALSVIVIGAPTFLMGGTLPAAARAIETGDDVRRRRVAVLYAANTVGAVAGALRLSLGCHRGRARPDAGPADVGAARRAVRGEAK